MKKAILIFMVFALLVTSSIAEGHEEVLFLMNMINESCLGSLSVERTAGWELVEKSKTDEMYIYSVFEEFEKTDYIFNFWKSDDGQFVTGFVAFMLLKEDELVGGWLPQFYHYSQMMDITRPFLKDFAKACGLSEEDDEYLEFQVQILTCCGEDRKGYHEYIGPNNSFMSIDFSEGMNAIRFSCYFGDLGVEEPKGQLPFTSKYMNTSIYSSVLKKYPQKEEAEEYFSIFDSIWGDLYEATGKIIYETLTKQQRELIHFPDLNVNSVYFTKDGKSYHSTKYCYTLLNSKSLLSSSLQEAVRQGKTGACSKCVD